MSCAARRRAFTLIEVAATMAVAAAVAGVAAVGFVQAHAHAREGRAHDLLGQVAAAQQSHYTSRGVFAVVAADGDDADVQALAPHEPGYLAAEVAPTRDQQVSVGTGTSASGMPFTAAATRIGDVCALRVAYPAASGVPAGEDTVTFTAAGCTAAAAAQRLS